MIISIKCIPADNTVHLVVGILKIKVNMNNRSSSLRKSNIGDTGLGELEEIIV